MGDFPVFVYYQVLILPQMSPDVRSIAHTPSFSFPHTYCNSMERLMPPAIIRYRRGPVERFAATEEEARVANAIGEAAIRLFGGES